MIRRVVSLLAGGFLALVHHVLRRMTTWSARGPGASCPGPVVFVNWHRDLPALIGHHGERRRCMLVSGSPRLEPVAVWCRAMGLVLVRGASGERGREALAALAARLAAGESVALAGDGPAGPPLVAKRGAFDLARAAGVPIVPVAARLACGVAIPGRWDRARVPAPFSHVEIVYGAQFWPAIPADVDAALEATSSRAASTPGRTARRSPATR